MRCTGSHIGGANGQFYNGPQFQTRKLHVSRYVIHWIPLISPSDDVRGEAGTGSRTRVTTFASEGRGTKAAVSGGARWCMPTAHLNGVAAYGTAKAAGLVLVLLAAFSPPPGWTQGATRPPAAQAGKTPPRVVEAQRFLARRGWTVGQKATAQKGTFQTGTTPVRVRAKFFFEGEKKFFIKGVTYGPFAPPLPYRASCRAV